MRFSATALTQYPVPDVAFMCVVALNRTQKFHVLITGRRKKNENRRRKREKKREILGGPAEGPEYWEAGGRGRPSSFVSDASVFLVFLSASVLDLVSFSPSFFQCCL